MRSPESQVLTAHTGALGNSSAGVRDGLGAEREACAGLLGDGVDEAGRDGAEAAGRAADGVAGRDDHGAVGRAAGGVAGRAGCAGRGGRYCFIRVSSEKPFGKGCCPAKGHR